MASNLDISGESLELDSEGEISEADLSIVDADFTSVTLAPTDWTVSVLVDMLRRGKIDLSPKYQRRIAWTEDKMSKFIESLFLRLPVPQIVLAELSPGKYAIIDGKQRVNSLARFCIDQNNPLMLKGCEYLNELNDQTYESLQESLRNEAAVDAFDSHTIRTVVVKSIPNNEVLYLLFLRLNQNSVSLSPQELRRALNPGPFLDWLDDVTSASEAMRTIFGKVPDFRMRDMEIATRYLSFKLFSASYSGNMKQFLDDSTRQISRNWSAASGRSNIESLWREFENAVSFTENIFGPDVFKSFVDGRYQKSKNRAVMDIMTYYFSDPQIRAAASNGRSVKIAFEKLCSENAEFLGYLQFTTKSVSATSGRFNIWAAKLMQTLNIRIPDFPLPRPV